ncbi:hypothetical protein WL05_10140 [Burkholderia ubonensis]|nr:hypothetical protein WJ51_23150 [Burkholderia ubonensis]KVM11426.1 hypothetical protein WJ52_21845 [Burkholderia ubonensis]KVM41747.1 hypothetical protein WJ56_31485 [Burkholderia ubonensis]KVX50944.1 hypothetical protein WL05_10140 [Burkholderia ubonensis]
MRKRLVEKSSERPRDSESGSAFLWLAARRRSLDVICTMPLSPLVVRSSKISVPSCTRQQRVA